MRQQQKVIAQDIKYLQKNNEKIDQERRKVRAKSLRLRESNIVMDKEIEVLVKESNKDKLAIKRA